MRKFFFIATVMGFSLLANTVNARSWRINHDPEAKADFLSINDAMKSADVAEGDVFYLDPGCRLSDQTITRKGVTIYGTGNNFEEENPILSGTTRISASSVTLIGIRFNGSISAGSSSCTNNRIERCVVTGHIDGVYNSLIQNCYISDGLTCYDNSKIYNNIIERYNSNTESGYAISSKNSFICNNSVLFRTNNNSYWNDGAIYCRNSTIKNNIIINTNEHVASDGTTYYQHTINGIPISCGNNIVNNVLSTDEANKYADYPTNKYIGNLPLTDIFVCEGEEGERFRLKEGSPAIGAGATGNDCGAYGGERPYVKWCRPRHMPYIYDAKIPAMPTDDKLNITLKIKTQDE